MKSWIPLFKQKKDLLKPKDLSALNAFASMWCCIENMFLAIMPCYIAIGKPADNATYNEQKEYAIEDKIHMNEW